MKEYLKRGLISFMTSAFAGLFINLAVDSIANGSGTAGFISMSPDYRILFPTPVIAAYVNVLLYGLIGFTFGFMMFLYDIERIGFLTQSLLYFAVTSGVCISITMVLWQLQKYPPAFIGTLTGYAVTHTIMIVLAYRNLRRDIREINECISGDEDK